MSQGKPRIFAINEFEVWSAITQADAVKASMVLSGLPEEYTLDPYHAKEISIKEASKRRVSLPDGSTKTLFDLYVGAQTVPCLLHTLETTEGTR